MDDKTNIYEMENQAKSHWGDYKLKAGLAEAWLTLAKTMLSLGRNPAESEQACREAVKAYQDTIQARDKAYEAYNTLNQSEPPPSLKVNP